MWEYRARAGKADLKFSREALNFSEESEGNCWGDMLTRGGELQMSFTVMPAGDPQTRVQRDFLRGTLVGHFRGTIFQRIAFPGGASGKESTCQRRRCRR